MSVREPNERTDRNPKGDGNSCTSRWLLSKSLAIPAQNCAFSAVNSEARSYFCTYLLGGLLRTIKRHQLALLCLYLNL